MKHHIEVVISDSEWVDILTVHSETGSAIGSSVPLENVQELICKLEKILNDKRNVARGEEKSCRRNGVAHEVEKGVCINCGERYIHGK